MLSNTHSSIPPFFSLPDNEMNDMANLLDNDSAALSAAFYVEDDSDLESDIGEHDASHYSTDLSHSDGMGRADSERPSGCCARLCVPFLAVYRGAKKAGHQVANVAEAVVDATGQVG
jgi:hypothetical protein